MYKHIVTWKLNDRNENITLALSATEILAKMRSELPGLVQIEIGVDSSNSQESSDLVLYSEFISLAAYNNYDQHDLHQQLKKLIGPRRSERRVIDYETVAVC